MGSFNLTCAISGLPIRHDDEVVWSALVQSSSLGRRFWSHEIFIPIGLPEHGVYNDYGCIELTGEDDALDEDEQAFNPNHLDIYFGHPGLSLFSSIVLTASDKDDNVMRSDDPKKVDLEKLRDQGFNFFQRKIRCGEVFLYDRDFPNSTEGLEAFFPDQKQSGYEKKLHPVYSCMILKSVWDAVKSYAATSKERYHQEMLAYRSHLFLANRDLAAPVSPKGLDRFRDHPMSKDRTYLESQKARLIDLHQELVAKENWEAVQALENAWVDRLMFEDGLENLRLTWRLNTFTDQDQSVANHVSFFKDLAQIALGRQANELMEMGEDEDDDTIDQAYSLTDRERSVRQSARELIKKNQANFVLTNPDVNSSSSLAPSKPAPASTPSIEISGVVTDWVARAQNLLRQPSLDPNAWQEFIGQMPNHPGAIDDILMADQSAPLVHLALQKGHFDAAFDLIKNHVHAPRRRDIHLDADAISSAIMGVSVNPDAPLFKMVSLLLARNECAKGEPRPNPLSMRPLLCLMNLATNQNNQLQAHHPQWAKTTELLLTAGASFQDSFDAPPSTYKIPGSFHDQDSSTYTVRSKVSPAVDIFGAFGKKTEEWVAVENQLKKAIDEKKMLTDELAPLQEQKSTPARTKKSL